MSEKAFDELSDMTQNVRGGRTEYLVYIPFAAVFGSLSVILYWMAGGLDLTSDLPFMAVGYILSVLGLTGAYSNVARWCQSQNSESNSIFFSVFYNNSFFVFLLVFFSSLIFSNMSPHIGLIFTSIASSWIPMYLSTLKTGK